MSDKTNLINKKNHDNELVKIFLNNQSKELEHKAQEISLAAQKDSNNFEFSKLALDRQNEDFEKQRLHNYKSKKARYFFATVVILLVGALLIYSLATNKDAFAFEILKTIVLLGAGGGAGYGFRAYQEKQKA